MNTRWKINIMANKVNAIEKNETWEIDGTRPFFVFCSELFGVMSAVGGWTWNNARERNDKKYNWSDENESVGWRAMRSQANGRKKIHSAEIKTKKRLRWCVFFIAIMAEAVLHFVHSTVMPTYLSVYRHSTQSHQSHSANTQTHTFPSIQAFGINTIFFLRDFVFVSFDFMLFPISSKALPFVCR